MKFPALARSAARYWSHPARGAWIEMEKRYSFMFFYLVAPRKGCVD